MKKTNGQPRESISSGGARSSGIRPGPPVLPLRGADIIDAEYEHVDALGKAVQSPHNHASARPFDPVRPTAAVPLDPKTGSAHRRLNLFSAGRPAAASATRWSAAGVVAIGLAVAGTVWFAGGYGIVSRLATDGGLTLSNLTAAEITGSGGEALMVEGTISNSGDSVLEVPLVAIENTEAAAQPPLFVRPERDRLGAGESTRFRVRVTQPVRGYLDLTVSLAGGSTGR